MFSFGPKSVGENDRKSSISDHAPTSSLEAAVRNASRTVDHFFDSSRTPDWQIPLGLLKNAQGLVFLEVYKGGFIWTGKVGTGCVIARLANGQWSGPSAISTAGVGFGAEVGGELINFMIILGSTAAVKSFMESGQVSIGAGFQVAAGPVGMSAGANAAMSANGVAPNYTYSQAKGVFLGVGLDGSIITSRNDLNQKYYGDSKATAKRILAGEIVPPDSANILYSSLERAFQEIATSSYQDSSKLQKGREADNACVPFLDKAAKVPSQASAEEKPALLAKVMSVVNTATKSEEKTAKFKAQCKAYGLSQISDAEFIGFLSSSFEPGTGIKILPDLVALLPTEKKQNVVWAYYLQLHRKHPSSQEQTVSV